MELVLTEVSRRVHGIHHDEGQLVATLQSQCVDHGLVRVCLDGRYEGIAGILTVEGGVDTRHRTHSHLILVGRKSLQSQGHEVVHVVEVGALCLHRGNAVTTSLHVLLHEVSHRVTTLLLTFERVVCNLLHLRVSLHTSVHHDALYHLLLCLGVAGSHNLTHHGLAALLVNCCPCELSLAASEPKSCFHNAKWF